MVVVVDLVVVVVAVVARTIVVVLMKHHFLLHTLHNACSFVTVLTWTFEQRIVRIVHLTLKINLIHYWHKKINITSYFRCYFQRWFLHALNRSHLPMLEMFPADNLLNTSYFLKVLLLIAFVSVNVCSLLVYTCYVLFSSSCWLHEY